MVGGSFSQSCLAFYSAMKTSIRDENALLSLFLSRSMLFQARKLVVRIGEIPCVAVRSFLFC